jgi:hypothetical protein
MVKRGIFPSHVLLSLGTAQTWHVSFFFNRLMPTIQTADAATDVLINFSDSAKRPTYAALSESSNIPLFTLWDRAHGRQPRREKAAKQQYLTPQEEKALVNYALRTTVGG